MRGGNNREFQEIVKPSMSVREEIMRLGGESIKKCYQCGICTVVCPISKEFSLKIRMFARYIQLGLEDKIVKSLDPWLCYYCGDCSKNCPRQAKPGEGMMALRRYLTSKYDWTGFSKILYQSKIVGIIAIIVIALITSLFIYLFHGPIIMDKVELNTFAPLHIIEKADHIIFIILTLLLLTNLFKMYKFVMGNIKKSQLSIKTYIIEFIKVVPLNFFSQKMLGLCTNKRYWIIHLSIFFGYVTSFILFVILLPCVHTNEPFLLFNPLSIVGIFATITLLYGIITSIYGRIKRNQPIWEYSHFTDWTFIILLLIITITGILTGIFRLIGLPMATYLSYSIHLIADVPFLILMVPFAKWSHLLYRPFALYFERLIEISSLKGVKS
ncbi:MAG: 4Fe-4S dicluster domain-containing protein [Nitrososphaerales archaeon]